MFVHFNKFEQMLTYFGQQPINWYVGETMDAKYFFYWFYMKRIKI